MKICPTCGQSMPIERLGVILSPFKAKIFDTVKQGGKTGIKPDDLYNKVFKPRSRNCMKSHIWQINELIGPHRINSVSKQHERYYRLEMEF